MLSTFAANAPFLALAGVSMLAIHAVFDSIRRPIRERTKRLVSAAALIDLHADTMEAATDDDRVPVEAAQALLRFSQSMLTARGHVRDLERKGCETLDWEGRVADHAPETAPLFRTAVLSGVAAGVLQEEQPLSVVADSTLAMIARERSRNPEFERALRAGDAAEPVPSAA